MPFIPQEAEILAGAMEPSAAYQKVVDFTIPVINSKVQIIYTSKFGLTPATKIAVLGGTATRDLLEVPLIFGDRFGES